MVLEGHADVTHLPPATGLGHRPPGILSLLLRGGVCLPTGFLYECHQSCNLAVLGQYHSGQLGPRGRGQAVGTMSTRGAFSADLATECHS